MFALDPGEACEVDFSRVVDQGAVNSWNEIVYPFSPVACGLESSFERVPVGARTHGGKSIVHLDSESIHGLCSCATYISFGTHRICGQCRGYVAA